MRNAKADRENSQRRHRMPNSSTALMFTSYSLRSAGNRREESCRVSQERTPQLARRIARGGLRLPVGVALVGLLLVTAPAWGLDPELGVSQYAHTAWKIRDGFTRGIISSIAQTPDGYLWLGTEFGLYRFDGVRAVAWEPPAGEQLPSAFITGLLVTRDGTLWISTRRGLASWKNGKLRNYPEVGENTGALIEDHEGTVWVGEWAARGNLCALRDSVVECYGKDGSLGQGVLSLYEDSKGNLWIGTVGGFWQWRPGPPTFHAIPRNEHYAPASFVQEADGSLLVAAREMTRFSGGKVEARPYLPPSLPYSFGQGLQP